MEKFNIEKFIQKRYELSSFLELPTLNKVLINEVRKNKNWENKKIFLNKCIQKEDVELLHVFLELLDFDIDTLINICMRYEIKNECMLKLLYYYIHKNKNIKAFECFKRGLIDLRKEPHIETDNSLDDSILNINIEIKETLEKQKRLLTELLNLADIHNENLIKNMLIDDEEFEKTHSIENQEFPYIYLFNQKNKIKDLWILESDCPKPNKEKCDLIKKIWKLQDTLKFLYEEKGKYNPENKEDTSTEYVESDSKSYPRKYKIQRDVVERIKNKGVIKDNEDTKDNEQPMYKTWDDVLGEYYKVNKF